MWVFFQNGGVVKFSYLIVVGQSFGCGFAVNPAEAAACFAGFVIDCFGKLEKALPESFGEVGQFFSTDQDRHQGEDEDNFTAAEIEQSKEGLHG